jgi:hypothetical protein
MTPRYFADEFGTHSECRKWPKARLDKSTRKDVFEPAVPYNHAAKSWSTADLINTISQKPPFVGDVAREEMQDDLESKQVADPDLSLECIHGKFFNDRNAEFRRYYRMLSGLPPDHEVERQEELPGLVARWLLGSLKEWPVPRSILLAVLALGLAVAFGSNWLSRHDIILLGTEEQVRLALRAANDLVAGHPIHTHELVVSLRDFIRKALDIAPIPSDLVIPTQGPARPSASGGCSKGDRRGEDSKQGGAKGGNMLGGAGGGSGTGVSLGTVFGPHETDPDHHG